MTIEEYVKVKAEFTKAFEDAEPPGWFFVKDMAMETVIKAIWRVKANPLTKFSRDKANLVLGSVRGTGRRSRLVGGK